MSVYKVIDIIGTSESSWEDAATTAINTAKDSLRGLRVAEVVQQDIDIADGLIYRVKLRVSFKFEG